MKYLYIIPTLWLLPQSLLAQTKSQKHHLGKFEHPHTLSSKQQTLVVCHASDHEPAWMKCKDLDGHHTYDYEYFKEHLFYIEPSDKSLDYLKRLDFDSFYCASLKLTGCFYLEKGYPLHFKATKETPEPAMVFRYTKIEVVSGGVKK